MFVKTVKIHPAKSHIHNIFYVFLFVCVKSTSRTDINGMRVVTTAINARKKIPLVISHIFHLITRAFNSGPLTSSFFAYISVEMAIKPTATKCLTIKLIFLHNIRPLRIIIKSNILRVIFFRRLSIENGVFCVCVSVSLCTRNTQIQWFTVIYVPEDE